METAVYFGGMWTVTVSRSLPMRADKVFAREFHLRWQRGLFVLWHRCVGALTGEYVFEQFGDAPRQLKNIKTMGDLCRAKARIRVDCDACGAISMVSGSEMQQACGIDPLPVGETRLKCPRCGATGLRITYLGHD